MQTFIVDQLCQVSTGHSRASAAFCSSKSIGPSRLKQQRNYARRTVSRAFTSTALHASFARTHIQAQTRVLRCVASNAAQHPQTVREDLYRQVDRLTNLLNSLQVAVTWHDKVCST